MPQAPSASLSVLSAFESLLHPSARKSREAQEQQSIFMAMHLAVGLIAFAALPVYLLAMEVASLSLALLPVWMLAPLLPVAYLSFTGNLDNAFLLTAALTASFITWIASMTGGLTSPHLIWLGVIPLEMALSGNRTLIGRAIGICAIAIIVLSGMQISGAALLLSLSAGQSGLISGLSVLLAILYGGLLAMRIEHLHRGRMKTVRSEEQRYRTIVDTVSDLITCHDLKGDVTFLTAGSRTLLNDEARHLLGNGLFQHIHIPDRPAYLQALSDCMQLPIGENGPVIAEVQLKVGSDLDHVPQEGKHGHIELRWVEMKCAPERNDAGDIVGAVVATRDISKRKLHEMEVEQARNEALAANEAKTRFLANVTHELRTPLNTIIGFSEILLHPELSQDDPERNREYAELIHNSGHHLLQLVNALLDMSRLESGNFEVCAQHFDSKDLIRSCCKMMKAEADKHHVVLFNQLDETIEDVNLDPRACRQILLNLMSNAVKFSHEGGKVAVSLGWAKDSRGKRNQSRIAVSVKDDGIGIASKDIDKLGKPFMQAENTLDRRFEGTGIGLSIVKGLTELQHGEMQIVSQQDVGTTVTVILPLDMEEVEVRELQSVVALPEKAAMEKAEMNATGKKVAAL